MIRRAETPEAKQGSDEQMLARVQKEGFASVLWEKTVCMNASIRVEKCIPDLYWISFFGLPYVEMFGREMLVSAPVSRSLQIGNGEVALKLVDTLDDNQLSYEQFQDARNRCKEHLGVDAFCSSGRSSYRTPKFHFPAEPATQATQ